MENKELFKVPDEREFDGMVLVKIIEPDSIVKIKNTFTFDSQDVLIASYPRSGNTWLSEALYLIHSNGDFEAAKQTHQTKRVLFLEVFDYMEQVQMRQSKGQPTVVKTHLPFNCFERQIETENARVIVVLRNPKDVLCSYYNFYLSNSVFQFKGSFEDFMDIWRARRLVYGDPIEWNLGYWKKRHLPNILVLTYEDAHADILTTLRKMCVFLNKELSEELLNDIKEHICFETMQGNSMVATRPGTTKLVRKGKVGDWQHVMTPAQSDEIDRAYEAIIEKTGLPIRYTP